MKGALSQDPGSLRGYSRERAGKPRTANMAASPAAGQPYRRPGTETSPPGMLWDGAGEPVDSHSRPPPAGMRGAFSWGVGPNAYEVDGRPGTRGGGPAFELDGRPGTRSGGTRCDIPLAVSGEVRGGIRSQVYALS